MSDSNATNVTNTGASVPKPKPAGAEVDTSVGKKQPLKSKLPQPTSSTANPIPSPKLAPAAGPNVPASTVSTDAISPRASHLPTAAPSSTIKASPPQSIKKLPTSTPPPAGAPVTNFPHLPLSPRTAAVGAAGSSIPLPSSSNKKPSSSTTSSASSSAAVAGPTPAQPATTTDARASPILATTGSRRGSQDKGPVVLLGKDLLKGSFIVDPVRVEPSVQQKKVKKHVPQPLPSPKGKKNTTQAKAEKEKQAKEEKERQAAAAAAEKAEQERIAAEKAAQAELEAAREAQRIAKEKEAAEALVAAAAAAKAAAEAAAAAQREVERLAQEQKEREEQARREREEEEERREQERKEQQERERIEKEEEQQRKAAAAAAGKNSAAAKGKKTKAAAPVAAAPASKSNDPAPSATHGKTPSTSSLPAIESSAGKEKTLSKPRSDAGEKGPTEKEKRTKRATKEEAPTQAQQAEPEPLPSSEAVGKQPPASASAVPKKKKKKTTAAAAAPGTGEAKEQEQAVASPQEAQPTEEPKKPRKKSKPDDEKKSKRIPATSSTSESSSSAASSLPTSPAPSTQPPVGGLLSPLSLTALKPSATSSASASGLSLGGPSKTVVMQDLLLEYFESRGLRRTLASFQQEQGETTARATGFLTPTSTGVPTGSVATTPRGTVLKSNLSSKGLHASPQLKKLNVIARLRRAFDSGDRAGFFSYLQTEAPDALRALRRDVKAESLLFWFHLYFAVYPLHPSAARREGPLSPAHPPSTSGEDAAKAMADFQRYLSSAATSDPAVLPYFGLPYIAEPKTHPTFSHLFEAQWLQDMQARAEKFLLATLSGSREARVPSETLTARRTAGLETRLEKIVLSAVAKKEEKKSSGHVSAAPAAEQKKKRTVVRRPILASSGSTPTRGSRGASPTGVALAAGAAPASSSAVDSDPMDRAPSSVSAPFSTSAASGSPSSSPVKVRPPPPAGISSQDVSRKDLHDALGMASKLSNLLNLLQMDLGSNADALSDTELADLQAKLQHLASKSSVLQKPKSVVATSSTVTSPSKEPPQTEGAFIRSASGAALRKLNDSVSVPQLDTEDEHGYFAWPGLNFLEINTVLRHGSPSEKAVLLQALRWRLTRSTPAVRKRHLQIFQKHDLLGCAKDTNAPGTLLEQLTSHPETQEQIARLLNVMSSYASGRNYLLRHSQLCRLLFQILQSHSSSDSPARQHALGSLQKFSLSRSAQSRMIGLGIMEWCVEHVLAAAADKLPSRAVSDYTVEYGTALLMNLSLRTSGKLRCERSLGNGTDMLSGLLGCIRMEELQFRTYINGTIYSLLSRRAIRNHAREIGLVQALQQLRPDVDLRVQQQFDYILRLVSSHEESDSASPPDEVASLSDDEDDASAAEEQESKESIVEPSTNAPGGKEEEEEEVAADADDDEDQAATAAVAGSANAGENFLQRFYSASSADEAGGYAAGKNQGSSSFSHLPLSKVPYPLPSSPTSPNFPPLQHSHRHMNPASSSAANSASQGLNRLQLDVDDLETPRSSSPLPGSSTYFGSSSASASVNSFPILKPTTPSNSKSRAAVGSFGAGVGGGGNAPGGRGSSVGMTSVRAVNVYPNGGRGVYGAPPQQARAMGKSPSAPVLQQGVQQGAGHVVASHLSPPAGSMQGRKLVNVPPLIGERRIPPPSSIPDETEKESLTRYYRAFATRAKVGRTPISSAFAEPGEFEPYQG